MDLSDYGEITADVDTVPDLIDEVREAIFLERRSPTFQQETLGLSEADRTTDEPPNAAEATPTASDGENGLVIYNIKANNFVTESTLFREPSSGYSSNNPRSFNSYYQPKPRPGASLGVDGAGSAGTLGMILRSGGEYYILSCAHVLLGYNPKRYTLIRKQRGEVYSPSPAQSHSADELIRVNLEESRRERDDAWEEYNRAKRSGDKKKIEDAKKGYNDEQYACEIWKRRKEEQRRGDISYCSGVYMAEHGVKGDKEYDYGIARITNTRRIGRNEIPIGTTMKAFKSGWKDPKEGMIVVKCGQRTGVTFGKVGRKEGDAITDCDVWSAFPLREEKVEKLLRDKGGLTGADGRDLRTDTFADAGDSGAVVLSYPDMTPVGLITSTLRLKGGGKRGCFTPLSWIFGRLKRETGKEFKW